jgi:aminopeptidase N
MLQLPSEAQLHERATEIQAQAIYQARHFARQAIAQALQEQLLTVYNRHNIQQTYAPVAEQIGRRALKNAALSYLMLIDNIGPELAWQQFQSADNMTDQAAALSALVNCPAAVEYAAEALQLFERQYQDEALVMNLWFQIQATNSQSNGLRRVQSLMQHSAFNMTNPNKVRSLIGAFCSANLVNFHNSDGSGYEFLQQQICALNSVNPQVAARLVTPLTRWKKFAQPNRQLMRDALETIAKQPNLVKDIQEIISKSL